MSALSSATVSPILATGAPVIDPALEPAAVRKGNQAAKNAYATGLAFEQVLIGELSKSLTATVSGTGSSTGGLGASSADGPGDGSSDPSTAIMGSDPASSEYAQLLPGALSSSVMASGGTGIAAEIADAIDPSLRLGAAR